jgi:hypothetical protein
MKLIDTELKKVRELICPLLREDATVPEINEVLIEIGNRMVNYAWAAVMDSAVRDEMAELSCDDISSTG